jgi:hypothetical protein
MPGPELGVEKEGENTPGLHGLPWPKSKSSRQPVRTWLLEAPRRARLDGGGGAEKASERKQYESQL